MAPWPHALALALGASVSASACGGSPVVTRIVGAETLQGPFVDGDAYAAFFRGAVAEEGGKWTEAVAAYEEARSYDDEDPEIWTRIGSVRCKASASDPEGIRSLSRALELDPDYGPAHLGLALCGAGDPSLEVSYASKAEPRAIEPQLWLSRLESGGDRLVALTLAEPRGAAYDALASYAASRGNPWLAVSASAAAAARDDSRAAAAATRCSELAGDGELGAARALAGRLVDLRARREGAPKVPPLVARLAVDDALERADEARAVARASSAHLGLEEVAARAILLGRPAIASNLASLVAAADPASAAAQAVRAAADEALGQKPRPIAASRSTIVPTPVALAYARALLRMTSPSAAADVIRGLRREPFRSGDALETSTAVDLAARGVLPDAELPLDAQLELAVRRRAAFPDAVANAARDAKSPLDARHRFLFLAWTAPLGQETARLAEHLTRSGSRDPLVGAALVHIASTTGKLIDAMLRDRLAATAPADPIVSATLIDAAPQNAEPAKRRLAPVAATKAERDLANF